MTRISTNPGKPRGRWTKPLAEIGGKRPKWYEIVMVAALAVVGACVTFLALVHT